MVIAKCVSWESVVGLIAVGQLLNSISVPSQGEASMSAFEISPWKMIRSFDTLSHASWPNYRKHFSANYMPHTSAPQSNAVFHESTSCYLPSTRPLDDVRQAANPVHTWSTRTTVLFTTTCCFVVGPVAAHNKTHVHHRRRQSPINNSPHLRLSPPESDGLPGQGLPAEVIAHAFVRVFPSRRRAADVTLRQDNHL